MPVDLPLIHVPHEEDPEVTPEDALSFEELAVLVALSTSPLISELHVPLPRQRWAVGRVGPDRAVWRVGDATARDRLGQAAWLWTLDAVFEANAPRACPIPTNLPLRTLIRHSSALAGTVRGTCDALVATIAALRNRRRPVAVICPTETFPLEAETGNPARWFALAVLTCLPPSWRRRLRVSTSADEPNPDAWDLVFTSTAPRGFVVVDPEKPASVDDDAVAAYLLDRLLAKDPEAVEAAAYLSAGEGDDPWGEGVRDHLRGGVAGFTSVEATQLQHDPEGAVQAMVRRLETGAEIRGAVAAELAAVTSRTWDGRPWQRIAERSTEERERAVRAVIPHLDPKVTPESFVSTVGAIGEIGAAVGPWAAFLVRVLHEGEAEAGPAAAEALEVIVATGPLDSATRASVWQEVVLALAEREDHEALIRAILSAASRRVASEGAGSVLAHAFLALPPHHRTANLLRTLVDAIASGPGSDLSMVALYRGLLAEGVHEQGNGERAASVARMVLQHWARLRTSTLPPAVERDRFLTLIRGTPSAVDWAEMVGPLASWERIKGLVMPVLHADPAQADRVWVAAESARATRQSGAARERLVHLSALLPEGGRALEALGRELLAEVIREPAFPDLDLSQVAASFAEVAGVSPLWMWCAITAGPAGTYDDDALDGTVMAFCERPPRTRPERVVAVKCVEGLAAAEGWSPRHLARWFVRLAMAPDGDFSGFSAELAEALVRAVSTRETDGIRVLVDLTRGLLQLDRDHPATAMLLGQLPRIWPQGPPPAYIDAIEVSALHDDVLARWRLALDLA